MTILSENNFFTRIKKETVFGINSETNTTLRTIDNEQPLLFPLSIDYVYRLICYPLRGRVDKEKTRVP